MSISTNTIDDFINQQISTGSCSTVAEAEAQITARLIERKIDAGIERGRADVKAGRVREATPENNKAFITRLEKKLFPNKSVHG